MFFGSSDFSSLLQDIFNVPGVGGVVSGFVNAGELTVGANCHVYVGPTDDGSFLKTVAKSAQEVFEFLVDIKNFEKLMPENIDKFEVLGDKTFKFRTIHIHKRCR